MANKKKEADKPVSKEEALKLAVDAITKKHGKGTIVSGPASSFPSIERIPTGSIGLDLATGGGWPRGRIVELYGPNASGKSTLCLHAIREAQKLALRAAYIDAEHALDIDYAQSIGVLIDALLVSQPDSGEQALDVAETLTRSGAVDLIVIDSVAALVPQAELEGEMGKLSMGSQARLMSQAMRKLAAITHRTNTCIIFINQIRMKIGIMFGSPETVAGGEALKFYASLRLDIRRKEITKDGEDKTGIRSQVKVVKNKTAPPFKVAEFNIIFGKGIDTAADLLDVAVLNGVVKRDKATFSINGESIGYGTAKVVEEIRSNPSLRNRLHNLLETHTVPSGTNGETEEVPLGL